MGCRCAPDEGVTVRRTGERHRNSNGHTNGSRENRGPNREGQRSGPAAGIAPDSHKRTAVCRRAQSGVAELGSLEERQVYAVGAKQHSPLSGGNQLSADQAKRKAKSDARNRARNNKRARTAMSNGSHQSQRELQILVGDGTHQQDTNATVPWDHRGLLGQTRGGGPGGS
jgi:hypothetical protein